MGPEEICEIIYITVLANTRQIVGEILAGLYALPWAWRRHRQCQYQGPAETSRLGDFASLNWPHLME